MKRQEPTPLTRTDLEALAESWQVRIDDLWPALEAIRPDGDDDPADDSAA